jgi:hypothetical protein
MPERNAKALASYLNLPKTDEKYANTLSTLNKLIDKALKITEKQETEINKLKNSQTNKVENKE